MQEFPIYQEIIQKGREQAIQTGKYIVMRLLTR